MAAKMKLCWSCEGEVENSATQCPYCGAELIAVTGDGFLEEETAPPYQFEEPPGTASAIPEPPYPTVNIATPDYSTDYDQDNWDNETAPPAPMGNDTDDENNGKSLTPIVFLSFGVMFFLFSFVLLLFSRDGRLTLQWSSSYWAVYLLLSLPSIYFGWRALDRVRD